MEQSLRKYDVHCTVSTDNMEKVNAFRTTCQAQGIKTVVYANGIPHRSVHVMTSVSTGSSDEAQRILAQVASIGASIRIPIIRRKLEVSPRPDDIVSAANYFEVHVAVNLPTIDGRVSFASNVWHGSRNTEKGDGGYYLTMRGRNTTFKKFKDKVKAEVTKLGPLVDKSKTYRIERCIFDDNVELDRSWMGKDA